MYTIFILYKLLIDLPSAGVLFIDTDDISLLKLKQFDFFIIHLQGISIQWVIIQCFSLAKNPAIEPIRKIIQLIFNIKYYLHYLVSPIRIACCCFLMSVLPEFLRDVNITRIKHIYCIPLEYSLGLLKEMLKKWLILIWLKKKDNL